MKLKIKDIQKANHDVKIFRLVPSLDFLPGQFINIFLNNIKRAYSIASSPLNKTYIEIAVKKIPNGKMSTYLHNLNVGDELNVSEAMGKFYYSGEEDIVLIAAGCGITPMMSIIRYCFDKKLDTKITLFYSVKTKEDIIYREELEKLKDIYKIIITLTREIDASCYSGRIALNMIKNNIKNIKEKTFFLCGGLDFVRDMVSILNKLGVKREQIKRDVWI